METVNDERKEKVSVDERSVWKLGYEHGDYEKMAERFKSHASKYSNAMVTGRATATTRREMNEFYADKKENAA